MNKSIYGIILVLFAASVASYAFDVPFLQDDKTRRNIPKRSDLNIPNLRNADAQKKQGDKKNSVDKQNGNGRKKTEMLSVILDQASIPVALLHPRWKIQRTVPVTQDDLDRNAADLNLPDNIKQEVIYNDSLNRYYIGSKMGEGYLSTPIVMTPDEYRRWSEKKELDRFFRSKNSEIAEEAGKDKFSFTDMHFALGPAEKIFGPGGVRVKTQGTAELKFGATLKNIDNPSLPIRNRKTTTMDFDEKVNLSLNGKVGDKVNMNLNYNTDATFDFDSQNLKLKYEGKEDEIIKLVEGGNVSFPSNSSLVKGASSLFGIRTDMQFGKLFLQTVVSQ